MCVHCFKGFARLLPTLIISVICKVIGSLSNWMNVLHSLSPLTLLHYLGTSCVFLLGLYMVKGSVFTFEIHWLSYLKWRMKLAGGNPAAQCMLSMHEPPGFNPQHQKQKRKRRMKTFVSPIHYIVIDSWLCGKETIVC